MTIRRDDPFPVISPGRLLHCFGVTERGPVRFSGSDEIPVNSATGRADADAKCISVGLTYEAGIVTITHLSSGLLHLVCVSDSHLEYSGEPWERAMVADPTHEPSYAYSDSYDPVGDMYVDASDEGGYVVSAGVYRVIAGDAQTALRVIDTRDNAVLLQTGADVFTFGRSRIGIEFEIGEEERVFGAGERMGFLDKRGKRYLNWNTDDPAIRETTDPLYQTVPFFTRWRRGGRSTGYFHDYPGVSWMDFDSTSEGRIRLHQADNRLSLFLCPGPDLSEVVRQYSGLTGTMELPPKWALGFHQSRYSYMNESEVWDLVSTFRTRRIPLDAVYLDIHYMEGYRVFTWNRESFPDPAAMTARLAEEGVRVVTIVDPGVKADNDYHVYRDGLARDVFARRSSGEVYHGAVWPGRAVFPDFTTDRAREFWADHHKALLGAGVSGIWNDMNEPADFEGNELDRTMFTPPLDVVLEGDGRPKGHMHYHNAYALKMAEATHAGFAKYRPDERPFLLTRAGYAGIQKYAAVWNGDIDSSWHHLAQSIPMFLNMGLSGIPFVGSDIGGFQSNASPQLYTRWLQYAVFTPYMRAHSAVDTRPHEPWSFGSTVEERARDAINLRYGLLPYLYSVFAHTADSGLPVMSPMVLHWPDDERFHALWDQFMFGPSIMVAPVLYPDQKRRLVCVPAGLWYDFHSGAQVEGPADIVVNTPIEQIPAFVRAAAVIPMQRPVSHTGQEVSTIELHCYPAPEGSSAVFELYEDDGRSPRQAPGYAFRRTSLRIDGRSLTVEHIDGDYRSPVRDFEVILPTGASAGVIPAGAGHYTVDL
ncbi:MAG: TIM-barrel domain-containing protein [bacterium]